MRQHPPGPDPHPWLEGGGLRCSLPTTPAPRPKRNAVGDGYTEGAWANAPHGSRSRYAKGGCRCDECKTAAARRAREKYARRRANGGRPDPGNVENICATCGEHFTAKRKRTYCARPCYLIAIGSAPKPDYWVNNAIRLTVYHRDGYRCQLCGEPVDMCADTNAPLAPTLDHIVPRARGGNDTEGNLRLAHRQCNVARGSDIPTYHQPHQ